MSVVEFGTVFGTQLVAVFQLLLVGLAAQLALPASERCGAAISSSAAANMRVKIVIVERLWIAMQKTDDIYAHTIICGRVDHMPVVISVIIASFEIGICHSGSDA
jgi:hypothetical protein